MVQTFFWLFIAIATGVLEALTADLVSIWFCAGAIVAMLLSYFHYSIWIQIGACALVALVLVIVTRPLAKKTLRGNIIRTNSDRVIGRKATVIQTIPAQEKGQVKVLGEIWSAVSIDGSAILEGSQVEVLAIEGVKLIVRPIL